MGKKVSIELRPEHALQYATILQALIEAGPQHPAFQGMFEDLKERILNACADQLTQAEVTALTSR